MKDYYTLLVRENKTSPWQVSFGDYDKLTVQLEQNDVYKSEYKNSDMKIIRTCSTQKAINEAVLALNAGL